MVGATQLMGGLLPDNFIKLLFEICIAIGVGIAKKKGLNNFGENEMQKTIEIIEPNTSDPAEEGFEEGTLEEDF